MNKEYRIDKIGDPKDKPNIRYIIKKMGDDTQVHEPFKGYTAAQDYVFENLIDKTDENYRLWALVWRPNE